MNKARQAICFGSWVSGPYELRYIGAYSFRGYREDAVKRAPRSVLRVV